MNITDVIFKYMDAWQRANPNFNIEDWYRVRHDFVESLAISLWEDCSSEEVRQTAIDWAYEHNPIETAKVED